MGVKITKPSGEVVHLKYFEDEEFIKPQEMWYQLLLDVDALRDKVGSGIVIKESNPDWFEGTQHRPTSWHYHGRALDIHAPNVPLWTLFLEASRFPTITGIGVYPYWHQEGLHIECVQDVRYRKYWWRDEAGGYRGLSPLDLQEVFLNTSHT